MIAIKKIVFLSLVFFVYFINPASGADMTSQQAPAQADSRTVVFPNDRSLGRLLVLDVNAIDTSTEWWWGLFVDWQYIGEATGKVTVPLRKKLALAVSTEDKKDLSPLTQLQPDDLDTLVIRCNNRDTDKPGDKCVPYICNLTGLKTLILQYTGISNDGLKLLTNISSLAQLSFISEELDDTGLANIAAITSLKGFRYYGSKVTNAGLSHMVKLTLLEELFPSSRNIDDDSMAYFSKLPRLRYLELSGENVSKQGLTFLQGLASLRKLQFLRPQISEEWMENLSKLVQLEDLAIQNTPISDEQIAMFKPPSLTKLRLQGGFQGGGGNFTDEGLAHLVQIKSIESLELYYGNFTDKGLEYLSELSKLGTLVIPNCHTFTDAGLKYLTVLKNLEHLNIGSRGLTDDGMTVIGQLTSLKELMLFNSRLITNQGISKLTGLRSLEKLELWVPQVTVTGLNHLDTLSNLTELEVVGGYADDIEPDDAILQIENLSRLEQLRLPVFCDEDLISLAKLQNLRHLEITNRGTLTAKSLAYLNNLTSLNNLRITNTHLTDDELQHIVNMDKLEYLTISGVFTEQGLSQLEALKGLIYLHIISPNSLSPEALQLLEDKLPNHPQIQQEIRELPTPAKLKLQLGQKLPDFVNISIDFSEDENKDKAILICFFDIEQRPSRNCILQLSKKADELKKEDVTIVVVHVSKIDEDKLNESIKEYNITFPVGMVEANEVLTRFKWGVKSLPWLILTDKQHIVTAEGFNINELDGKIKTITEK